MALLNTADKDRVAAAVLAAEANTAGELVVAVIRRSDDYAYFRGLVAVIAAIGLGWAGYVSFPTLHSAWVFSSQVVVWGLLWWATAWGPLLRFLVPKPVQVEAVSNRAKLLFMDHGLTETRDRSAVLILVSETEHRVQILADRGIYERLGQASWDKEVQGIVASVRQGRATDGLCSAVASIGARLAEHFPARHDDKDELSNAVVELRSL
jgi:putative membrane protein